MVPDIFVALYKHSTVAFSSEIDFELFHAPVFGQSHHYLGH